MIIQTHIVRNQLDLESYSLRNMYLSVLVVKMTYTYIGAMLAWTSPVIPDLDSTLGITAVGKVAILVSLPLGTMVGPAIGSVLAPRYGFKSIFLLFGCLSFTSVLLLAFGQVLVISVARLAAGVALGAFLCYVEAYLHDISDQEVRVLLNPLSLVFMTLGFFLVYDLSQILSYFEVLLVLLIVPSIFLVCLVWLPESPYFYVAAGDLEKAKKSVDFLHRGISTRGLDHMMPLIEEDVRRRKSEGVDHIFMPPYHKHPEAAGVTLLFFLLLPLTGFPVILMLLEPLMRKAEQDLFVNFSLATIAKVNLLLIAVAWPLNSYCRDKLKMMASSAVMSLSIGAFGMYFIYLEAGQDMSDVSWVPLISTVFYISAFLVGFVHKTNNGSSDFRLRSCGRVHTLSSGFFSMFLVVLLFIPMKDVLGTAPILWTFSAFSILLTIFIGIYSPEATFF